MKNTPLNATASAQEIPRVIRTAGCKRVGYPLHFRRSFHVTDGTSSSALARELVFLHAADDDGAALTLGGRQRRADELGRECLQTILAVATWNVE